MKFNVLILSLLLIFSGYSAAEIYKCNINGKPVFTDAPCGGSVMRLEDLNVFSPVESDESKKVNIQYSSSKWFVGYEGYQKALIKSEQYDVPIFVYFQADWCRYCRLLEKGLLNTRKGRAVLKKVVKVRITPENSVKEKRLFEAFRGTGYPSVHIKRTSSSMAKKFRLLKKKGNKSVAKTVSYLKKITSGRG